MDPISGLIVVALLLGPTAYTWGAIKHARANGRAVPSREDWKPRWPSMFTSRQPAPAATATTAAGKAKGAKVKTRKGKPQTVPAILAAGLAENWVASRAHRRANPKPSQRHRIFDRLVFPGGRRGAAPKPPEAAQDPKEPPGGTPMAERSLTSEIDGTGGIGSPLDGPAEPPSPISSNGHSSGGGSGGGAAADFFHSITAVTGPAKAGGIKSKQRAVKTLAAGMPMMASALEEFARWCQEPAQGYGAPLFERLQKMANCIRAAGMEGAEADTYMTELANKPLGEVAGSRVQAPSSREINTE